MLKSHKDTCEIMKEAFMNKTDLVNAVAEKTGLSKVKAAEAVDGIISVIGDSLKRGDKVSLVGFGTFEVVKRAERKGRNPQTGQEITIPAKNVVRFKAGKKLKDLVN